MQRLLFIFNSVMLGVGLAMDAFCVSMANGLAEPDMRRAKQAKVAGVYAFFQWLMPLIGWVCVRTVASYFRAFQKLIPWIALILLLYIGGKMLVEGIRNRGEEAHAVRLTLCALMLQGVATSIDALSVGFAIAAYRVGAALLAACIIAAVTFVICAAGLVIGRRAGTALAGRANILGGAILIVIGLEIFLKGILG